MVTFQLFLQLGRAKDLLAPLYIAPTCIMQVLDSILLINVSVINEWWIGKDM